MKIKTELLKAYIFDIINEHILEFEIDVDKIADTTAITMIEEIQRIIKDDNYSDFEIVEEIVHIFEKYKIDSGSCHDF